MQKLVVLSDNHSNRKVVEEIFKQYEQEQVTFIHCGDSEFPAKDKLWEDVVTVTGNCDFDAGYAESHQLEIEGHSIFVTHGHLYGLNLGLPFLVKECKKRAADMVLFGHIHRPVAEIVEGVLCINPGSVTQSRDAYIRIPTYATVTIDGNTVEVVHYTTDHEALLEHKFTLEV